MREPTSAEQKWALYIYSAIRPSPAALPCRLAFTCDSTGKHTSTDRTQCSQCSKDPISALITMHDEMRSASDKAQ